MRQRSPTAQFASFVYGGDGVQLDDPAEAFHEASRLYPDVAPERLTTLLALARSPELQQTADRASRTHSHRPGFDLPCGAIPPVSFSALLARRRSSTGAGHGLLQLRVLGALLEASYSSSVREPGVPRRPVPSAGALYPLELYVLALRVETVEPAVLHYDPFRHRLEALAALEPAEVGAAVLDPAVADSAAALLVVTAMFWRSRFKYGTRGYRFALLEAGHAVQNAVLAAAALRVPALPVGGFYDRKLDALVGADGLDEASVYALVVGDRE
jgi:SagB-type dehydrogenase family enzyme